MKTIPANIFIKNLSKTTATIIEIRDIRKNAKLNAIITANLPLISKTALIPNMPTSIPITLPNQKTAGVIYNTFKKTYGGNSQ